MHSPMFPSIAILFTDPVTAVHSFFAAGASSSAIVTFCAIKHSTWAALAKVKSSKVQKFKLHRGMAVIMASEKIGNRRDRFLVCNSEHFFLTSFVICLYIS